MPINWVWSLGLGVIGILTFVVSGRLDKLSVVPGPLFLVSQNQRYIHARSG